MIPGRLYREQSWLGMSLGFGDSLIYRDLGKLPRSFRRSERDLPIANTNAFSSTGYRISLCVTGRHRRHSCRTCWRACRRPFGCWFGVGSPRRTDLPRCRCLLEVHCTCTVFSRGPRQVISARAPKDMILCAYMRGFVGTCSRNNVS